MLEWVIKNSEKVTIVTLLMLVTALVLTAWWKEWFVLGSSHRRDMADKDAQIERTREECRYQREMNERLLAQLERSVTIAERVAPPIRTVPRGR